MMMKSIHDSPILVAGAAGAIGRNLTAMLLAKGHKVRALVRREDERADALRRLGAEVVQGDLTDLASMHRAIEGCGPPIRYPTSKLDPASTLIERSATFRPIRTGKCSPPLASVR
jgi:nucleoside-diphosphate-sugar epimerase